MSYRQAERDPSFVVLERASVGAPRLVPAGTLRSHRTKIGDPDTKFGQFRVAGEIAEPLSERLQARSHRTRHLVRGLAIHVRAQDVEITANSTRHGALALVGRRVLNLVRELFHRINGVELKLRWGL